VGILTASFVGIVYGGVIMTYIVISKDLELIHSFMVDKNRVRTVFYIEGSKFLLAHGWNELVVKVLLL